VLHATFSAEGIEIGLAPALSSPESTERLRAALTDARDLQATVAALTTAGWEVSAGGWPRVSRMLPWEPWIGEPGLSTEIADRFRELLPVFDAVRLHPDRVAGPGSHGR
jgi:hypothetical protein